MREIEENDIELYQFPECESDEEEDFVAHNQRLKSSVPFAIVSSNIVVSSGSQSVRARQYPWGVVEVENPAHSDFALLRQFIVQTHMHDLRDVTHEVHYENYR